MKINRSFILLVSIVVFLNCSKLDNKAKQTYNGVNFQILNIVDSIKICFEEKPFITIVFKMYNDSDCIVQFFNGILIPPPLPPPATIREVLISEKNEFSGYKKYDNIYLVFEEYNSNGKFEKFVNRDSLNFDEEPFINYNVYDWNNKYKDCDTSKKTYLINKNDSLVFWKKIYVH
jgi:NhaP-type Na+/H+ and K+/H+ antiporter